MKIGTRVPDHEITFQKYQAWKQTEFITHWFHTGECIWLKEKGLNKLKLLNKYIQGKRKLYFKKL